jgi:DNA anti-recombination protein RmuC
LVPEVQESVQASPNIYQAFVKANKDGYGEAWQKGLNQELLKRLQKIEELKEQVLDNQKEMKQLQEEVKQLQEKALSNQEGMKGMHQ